MLLVPHDRVQPLDLLRQSLAFRLQLATPILPLPQILVFGFAAVECKLKFLVSFDLVVKLVLEHLLILLKKSHFSECGLELSIFPLPGLNFLEPGLEDAIDALVLGPEHGQLAVVVREVVFQVFVLGEFGLLAGHPLLPSLDFV